MKIRFIFAMVLGLLTFGANAQEGIHLSVYFSPASHDASPSVDNVSKYSIYLTERNGQELSAIQSAVLTNPAALNDFFYICHAQYWNTECSQYATLDMSQDATDETLLDGRYVCTPNTLAVIVYENGSTREVLVIPGADEYFYEFFDDSEQPGTGWGENGGTDPVAISAIETAPFTAYAVNGAVVVNGVQGADVQVYNLMGRQVASAVAASDVFTLNVPASGVYVVRVNGISRRVYVR